MGKYCNIILVVGKYDHNGQEWDTNQSGSISVDQMSEIYRIYKVVDFCLRNRHLNRKCILILIDGQNCFQGGAGHGRTSAQDWPGRPGLPKNVVFVFYCLFVWLVLEARFLKICSVCLSVCLLGGFSTFSKCESFEATKSPAFLESSFSLECKFLSSHR